MARRRQRGTGTIRTKQTSAGLVFEARFRAYGERRFVRFGTAAEGWTEAKAGVALDDIMADVRRGIWKPPEVAPAIPEAQDPTFHEWADEWFERHEPEWRNGTAGDYKWALEMHLLPFFAEHCLSEITVAEVDRYKLAKLKEGKLAAATINKTLTRLGQILEEACEYEHLALNRNAVRVGKRKLKAPAPKRSWVEPEQLPALLDASDAWIRPVVAMLVGAGLRVGEAVSLDWRDVNLATGTVTVHESKTDAGAGRRVDLPAGAMDELREWKARTPKSEQADPVFVSRPRKGVHARQTKRNVEARLKGAITEANKVLAKQGIEPISEKVSPHSLRRTYASVRAACGDDPVYIAEQGGWTDPGFALRVYAQAVKRRERLNGEHRKAFDEALAWASVGSLGSGLGTGAPIPAPATKVLDNRAHANPA